MIVSADERVIISHMGWVDHGAIWLLRVDDGDPRPVGLGEAQYLRLREGVDDFFSAAHYFSGELRRVSVHRISAPELVVAQLSLERQSVHLEGDKSAWGSVPLSYTGYLPQGTIGAAGYYLVRVRGGDAEVQALTWFNDDSYDLGYQTALDPTDVPGTDLVIIPIQRCSQPVLFDAATGTVVRELTLANRYGNPTVVLRPKVNEAWVIDYDTLLRLDMADWSVKDKLLIQPDRKGVGRFVGELGFTLDNAICAVARPYSGDVVAIDTKTFRLTQQVTLGRQPLDVATLEDRRVFARDWQTGDLLFGKLDQPR